MLFGFWNQILEQDHQMMLYWPCLRLVTKCARESDLFLTWSVLHLGWPLASAGTQNLCRVIPQTGRYLEILLY